VPKATKRERQRVNREIRREAIRKAEQRRKTMHTVRNVAIAFVIVAIAFGTFKLIQGDDTSSSASASTTKDCMTNLPTTAETTDYKKAPPLTIDPKKSYYALIQTSEGPINIALDAKTAPQTVNSFIFLACNSFYNGTTFHRIVTDFVDQGGDPKGDGTGGPGYKLKDEPPKNPYAAGDVAMANAGTGTTGSQFFLTVSDNGAAQLNAGGAPYKYSMLGKMDAAGLQVAQTINSFGSADGKPTKQITISGVQISTGKPPTAAATTTAPPTSTTP